LLTIVLRTIVLLTIVLLMIVLLMGGEIYRCLNKQFQGGRVIVEGTE
jgi:hypothetical protein